MLDDIFINKEIIMNKIRLTETDLINLIKNVINEQTGVVKHPMIQQCKQILNNVPGTSTSWKQNMKQRVLRKPCMWVRNRMSFFHNKMNMATPGSGAYKRFQAKAGFLECLLGQGAC